MVRPSPVASAEPGAFEPAARSDARPPGVFGLPGPAAARSSDLPAPEDPPTVPVPALVPRAGVAGRVRAAAARLVPVAWRGARLDPGRPGATALALAAAVAAIAAAVGVWLDRPQAAPVPALPAVSVAGSTAPATSDSPPAAPAPLVVSVSGKVRHPGLVRLPGGARVADVLDAAGGALPGTDVSTLNLARHAVDGEQIAVGVPAAADAGGGSLGGGGATAAGPLDLNTATVEQLDVLPGVGPVTAQKIVDWRAAHGRFARLDQLREVPGIGERKFEQLRSLVRVG